MQMTHNKNLLCSLYEHTFEMLKSRNTNAAKRASAHWVFQEKLKLSTKYFDLSFKHIGSDSSVELKKKDEKVKLVLSETLVWVKYTFAHGNRLSLSNEQARVFNNSLL